MARRYELLAALVLGSLLLVFLVRSEDPRSIPEAYAPQKEISRGEGPDVEPIIQPSAGGEQPESARVRVAEASSPPPDASRPSEESLPATGLAISGRVVDDVGAAVPRFTIEVTRPGAEEFLFGVMETIDGPTVQELEKQLDAAAKERYRECEDPEGKFRLDGLSPGQWQLIARLGSDRRSAPVVTGTAAGVEDITLVLPRMATLSGIVSDAAGTAVPGASVFLLLAAEDEPRFHSGLEPEPRAQADEMGQFRIDDVLPGVVAVMARHADYSDGDWMDVEVAPGEHRDGVRITLHQGGRVEGSVDLSLGQVANRKLGLFSFRGSIGWRDAETDASGRFVIEHVIPQDYVIELRPAGYGEPGFEQQPGIRKVITVEEGKTTEVDFSSAIRSILVHGTIRLDGAPAPGLTVRAHSKEGGEDRGERFTTGVDGRFEVSVDRPGDWSFHVSAGRGSYVWLDRTIPDADTVEQDFDVPSGRITGRVSSADGELLAGVPVTLLRDGDPADFWARYRVTHTRPDGSFEFSLLLSGTYALRAPDGFWSSSPPEREPHGRVLLDGLVLETDRPIDLLDVHLRPEGRISGQVVDGRGNSVGGAGIVIEDLDGRAFSAYWDTESDATGHFEVPSIAPGTYRVFARAEAEEGRSEPVLVEAGRTATAKVVLQ